jgi:predicted amidophosphoribosyltransferase
VDIAGYALAKKIEELSEDRPVILIPIPTTYRKLCARGYNPPELISRALVNNIRNVSVCSKFLCKKYWSWDQKTKSRSDRIKNRVVFNIHRPIEIQDNCLVILIDDVTTTGSTLSGAIDVVREYLDLKDIRVSIIGLAIAN